MMMVEYGVCIFSLYILLSMSVVSGPSSTQLPKNQMHSQKTPYYYYSAVVAFTKLFSDSPIDLIKKPWWWWWMNAVLLSLLIKCVLVQTTTTIMKFIIEKPSSSVPSSHFNNNITLHCKLYSRHPEMEKEKTKPKTQ